MIAMSNSARSGIIFLRAPGGFSISARVSDISATAFTCHAAEDAPRELYFLRKLRAIAHKKFEILDEPALTCRKVRETAFDVVLALKGVHRFLKKRSFEFFVDLLRNLKTEELFFDPNVREGLPIADAYRDLTSEDLVAMVWQNTRLKFCERIGEYPDGRKLYRLSAKGRGRCNL